MIIVVIQGSPLLYESDRVRSSVQRGLTPSLSVSIQYASCTSARGVTNQSKPTWSNKALTPCIPAPPVYSIQLVETQLTSWTLVLGFDLTRASRVSTDN